MRQQRKARERRKKNSSLTTCEGAFWALVDKFPEFMLENIYGRYTTNMEVLAAFLIDGKLWDFDTRNSLESKGSNLIRTFVWCLTGLNTNHYFHPEDDTHIKLLRLIAKTKGVL